MGGLTLNLGLGLKSKEENLPRAGTQAGPRTRGDDQAWLQSPLDASTLTAMTTHQLFFDGAAEPNPGHGSAGWVIVDLAGENGTVGGYEYVGENVTNNVAEYTALLKGMMAAHALGIRSLDIFGDSKLIVNQAQGLWKCKQPHLQPYVDQYRQLVETFTEVTLEWVPREENELADEMSKQALSERGIEGRDWKAMKAAKKRRDKAAS